ncbi:kinase domain protein [Ceratobasidium sp. AG-Ba]|nr:kinase domain protein [Ceratobasidium sp. AG-Ba]QRV99424.1 kinase domain protein [Ceratobasidium sp. AG-Ba]QRW13931.1 kinase domain protein [Ceratobasidium sp. AG-Ba]
MPGPVGRFFPYIFHHTDPDEARIEFNYIKFLSGKYSSTGKSISLAETRNVDAPMRIIVKFVQTHCGQPHNLLSKAQLVPPLLYDSTRHPKDWSGPEHYMIVMGLIHGVNLSNFEACPPPARVLEDVDKALELLHSHNLVFRDLRNPNVMVEMDPEGNVTGAKHESEYKVGRRGWAGAIDDEVSRSCNAGEAEPDNSSEDKVALDLGLDSR